MSSENVVETVDNPLEGTAEVECETGKEEVKERDERTVSSE